MVAKANTNRGTNYALASITQRRSKPVKLVKQVKDYGTQVLRDIKQRTYTANIVYRYSKKSKNVPYVEGYESVRFRDKTKAYINTVTGEVVQTTFVERTLYGIDRALFGDQTPYLDAWLKATPEQRAKILQRMKQVDWNDFWAERYHEETGTLDDTAEIILDMIFSDIPVDIDTSEAVDYTGSTFRW